MKRKQRKSLPWRRFGYAILIIIKFGELLLWFSPRIIKCFEKLYQTQGGVFHQISKHLKVGKKNSACAPFFNPLLSGYLMKHSSLCLIYYLKTQQIQVSEARDKRLFHLFSNCACVNSESNCMCHMEHNKTICHNLAISYSVKAHAWLSSLHHTMTHLNALHGGNESNNVLYM